jgi:pimeloyl-ACP methyl ester carboxylesterase
MAIIEATDGVKLYAERHPDGEGASGLPIVFSCAYSTTHANWRSQVEPLVAAGHRVALWDYRGHGRSEVPGEIGAYTMEQVVSDLGRVIDWIAGDGRCVLAGLSFGGLASLHFAVAHPERVAGLMVVGSGPGFKNPEAAQGWKERSEKTADYIESRGMEAFVTGKAAPTCIGRDPELPAARVAADGIRAQNPAGVARFGRHVSGLALSVIDELPGIEAPCLIVVGADDKAFLRAGEVMHAKLPRSRHELIPGAGHIVNIEAAERFNGLMVEFVEEVAQVEEARSR